MSAKNEPHVTWKVALRSAIPAIGGLLFGYDSGYINGVLGMNQFKYDFGSPSTDPLAYKGFIYKGWEKSLIVSILSAGTFIGAISAGYFADKTGRKTTIFLGALVYTVGVVMQMATDSSVGLLIAGRFVAGLGVGFISAAVVMFLSEITPKRIRGKIIGCYQLAITIGLFLSACTTYGTKDRMDSSAYRIPIGLQFAWVFALVGGCLTLPESPRYHVMKGNSDRAKHCLGNLRSQAADSPVVLTELAELERSYAAEIAAGAGSGGWLDCIRGGFRQGSNLQRTFIGTVVQIMQQLTGVNFVFYFGTTFFETIGIRNPFVISIVLSTVNVLSTPAALLLIDKWGRRPLLIYGAIGMAICEFIVAIVGTTVDSDVSHKVLIAFVCIYIVFFATTWGPTSWAVSGEVFPLPIRSKGIALSTASNWLFNFVIAFVTPYLVDPDRADLGARVFFIWGSTCAACAAFAYACVYETKGLELEEIDTMMRETRPWRSARWRAEPRGGARDAELAPMASSASAPSGGSSAGWRKRVLGRIDQRKGSEDTTKANAAR